jgi:hypothetical protein
MILMMVSVQLEIMKKIMADMVELTLKLTKESKDIM